MIKADSSSGANTIKMDDFQLAALHRYQDSLQTAMAKASADSAQQALLRQRADSVQAAMKKLQADTAQLAAKLRTMNSAFALTPDKPHSVLIVMTKVDPVYVSEARNAFNGYNQENFYSQSLTDRITPRSAIASNSSSSAASRQMQTRSPTCRTSSRSPRTRSYPGCRPTNTPSSSSRPLTCPS
jgi:hypothetical protein